MSCGSPRRVRVQLSATVQVAPIDLALINDSGPTLSPNSLTTTLEEGAGHEG